jgi:tripartite-type tricarboxylate transporter receptor subunit TctC
VKSKLSRRAGLGLSMGAFATAIGTAKGGAQPLDRVARIINGFPPGGSSDTVARLYAENMRESYAPQVIVESRSGAGGRIALEVGKAAVPDGTTLIQSPAGQLTIYPHIYRRLNYSLEDFAPVSPLVAYAQVLAVAPNHPAGNLAEFADWAKKQGNEISYGSAGAGTWAHFMGVQIGKLLGIPMTHVPYRGTTPGLQDLLGGQLASMSCVLGEATELYRAGRLRILGVSSPARAARVPEVMTYAEQGFPALTSEEWFGLFLPGRTPPAIVESAHRAVQAAAAKPELRAALERLEYRIPTSTPAEFAARIRREREAWAPVIAESGFQAEE